MQSLSRQISFIFQLQPLTTETQRADFKAWVEYFHSLLLQHAVILVIDSLDQLSNDNEVRSQLSFLKGVRTHRDTRIIVSCLPDETDELICG
jgi:hypothetical protein